MWLLCVLLHDQFDVCACVLLLLHGKFVVSACCCINLLCVLLHGQFAVSVCCCINLLCVLTHTPQIHTPHTLSSTTHTLPIIHSHNTPATARFPHNTHSPILIYEIVLEKLLSSLQSKFLFDISQDNLLHHYLSSSTLKFIIWYHLISLNIL